MHAWVHAQEDLTRDHHEGASLLIPAVQASGWAISRLAQMDASDTGLAD